MALTSDKIGWEVNDLEFLSIFSKMAELFLVIIIGFAAYRLKAVDSGTSKMLSRVVVYVTLPCYMISSVTASSSIPSGGEIIGLLGIAIASQALQLVMAMILPRLMGLPRDKRGVYSYMIAFGNVGFIGYPTVTAILGQEAIFVNTVLNLPFNVLSYSIGVFFLVSGDQKPDLKRLISPAAIAAVVSLILAFIKPTVPEVLNNAMTLCGQVTTPAALLIIGMTLGAMPIREMFGGWRIYLASFVRLVVTPLLLWLILKSFVTDPLVLACTVIICGMPAATNGTMLCLEYGADSKTMSQGTFITTVCFLITTPLLAMLVG